MIFVLFIFFCGLIGLWGKKFMLFIFVLLLGVVEILVEVLN